MVLDGGQQSWVVGMGFGESPREHGMVVFGRPTVVGPNRHLGGIVEDRQSSQGRAVWIVMWDALQHRCDVGGDRALGMARSGRAPGQSREDRRVDAQPRFDRSLGSEPGDEVGQRE